MARKREVRARILALVLLGGKCVSCGTTNLRLLQIDHVDGGGTRERIDKGIFGKAMVRAILDGKRRTDDLQLLCANCHHMKTYSSEFWEEVVAEVLDTP